MARKARVRSQSGIYHVILRGFGLLFDSDDDAAEFLRILKAEKEDDFAEVYAYCLLNDRIHLILKEGLKGVSNDVMKISSRYVSYVNASRGVKGALFNGRFESFPLEDGGAVLNAVRRVHRLPLKHGAALNYEWSSYPSYFKKDGVTDPDAVILLAGSMIDFKIFNETPEESESGENADVMPDGVLIEKIKEMFRGVDTSELERLSESQNRVLLKKIKAATGASEEAIARVFHLTN